MKVLLDHNLSEHLIQMLPECEVWSAKQMLWDQLRNGDLLRAGEMSGFAVMLTADQSIWYQQNNARRQIALLVVNTNDLSLLTPHVIAIQEAVHRSSPGSYEFLELVPRHPKRPLPPLKPPRSRMS